MIYHHFIGIDVAKLKLDVAFKSGNRWIETRFDNDKRGHEAFIQWVRTQTEKAFVCLEATGPYGEILAECLVEQGIPVSVVNPLQIKYYAKSLLSRNKNDRVDARIIASYAEKFVPRLFVARSADQKWRREAFQLIDTLQEQKRQLQNQRSSLRSAGIREEVERMVEAIEKRLSALEKKMQESIKNQEEFFATQQRLLTIIGIGEKTANRIIAYVPAISDYRSAKQLAAFAGLSPKQYQSGSYRGKTQLSKAGNSQLRKALYMPAIVAKNNNPHLKAFCERLKKKGLKPKQIVCAVMRKLIHIIFGMLKHKQNFNPALV